MVILDEILFVFVVDDDCGVDTVGGVLLFLPAVFFDGGVVVVVVFVTVFLGWLSLRAAAAAAAPPPNPNSRFDLVFVGIAAEEVDGASWPVDAGPGRVPAPALAFFFFLPLRNPMVNVDKLLRNQLEVN
jgi:hypothetical protein